MKKINGMTIQEKIGQLVWVGFQGYEFNDNLKYLIDKYKVGNIVLFTRNIKDIKQLFALNKEIHEYITSKTDIMPFISIDQEGGMVTRIMDGATFCPGNMTLATSTASKSYEIGQIMGKELRALGINMNLAPSLDVNNNPINPVIGVRSYSDDPNVVSEYGKNYIRGLQEQGIIATSKHFPGHGDTDSDSHKSLPTVAHNKERLAKVELLPFIKNLNETKAIMSAHVFFPAYEKGNLPGTLSRNVITNLLKKELGYKGLVISDCMEMKAIDDNYTTPKGCLMGLKAGLDQVMVSATFEKQVASFEEIHRAYENGELTIEEIDEKVEKILKLKEESYPLMKEYFYDKSFEEVVSEIDNEKHKQVASSIVDNSLTLVKGKNLSLAKKTLVIAAEPFATTIAEDELNVRSIASVIKEHKIEVDVEKIEVRISDEEIKRLVKKAKFYEQVLVCTYNANLFTKQADLVNALDNNENELFVLSTRSPYDIYRFEQIKNYLCLYEYTPNSVQTIAKYLKGDLEPKGKLPVNLQKKTKVGASLYVGLKEYPVEKNFAYLDLLKEEGIEEVFISAHIPEMNKNFLLELNKVCEYAQKNNIKVILDVSKKTFTELVLPKVYALRLDYGFTLDEIIEYYKKKEFVVELNASTISVPELLYLKKNGVCLSDVRISHNFYPKKYTGLSFEDVIKKNKEYHNLGMSVTIYIPSSNEHRPPMYEGLPTCEVHRNMNLYAILSTIKYLECDGFFFGDAYASREEIKLALNFDYDICIIPIEVSSTISVYEKEILQRMHANRRDENPYFIRSSCKSFDDILPNNTIKREKYMVTIDNVKFGRYQGEVCIIKEDLEADERVNVVGKAHITDEVLKAIKGGKKFKFIIVQEFD